MKMVNRIIWIATLMMVSTLQGTEDIPHVLWQKTWGWGPYIDRCECVRHTRDGGYILVGTMFRQESNQYDAYIAKTDGLGNIEWQQMFGTPYDDCAYHVEQTLDGGYAVVGDFGTVTGYYAFFRKYDSNGGLDCWHDFVPATYANCVCEVVDDVGTVIGYVVVGGCGITPPPNPNLYLAYLWPNGGFGWDKALGGGGTDFGSFVQQVHYDTQEPGFIIAGSTTSYGHGMQAWLYKVDLSGNRIWESTFGDDDIDYGYCVRESGDGYALAGRYRINWQNDMWLIKTDFQGNHSWDYKFGGSGDDCGYSLCRAADGGYVLAGYTGLAGSDDVYVVRTDAQGQEVWSMTIGNEGRDRGFSIDTIDGGIGGYIIGGEATPSPSPGGDILLAKLGWWVAETDDPFSLAYNGNRHFVRQQSSANTHLIFGADGHVVYTKSADYGANWTYPDTISEGIYPTITLATDNLPAVAWTDEEGGLWYGKRNALGEWSAYHLYDSSPYDPYLNTPPSIVVTRSLLGDTVHILATLFLEDIEHLFGAVVEYAFPISNPAGYTVNYLEGGSVPSHKFCYNPSITKDFQERLHAIWQRGDTICYATRAVNQNWSNWGWQFYSDGLQSAHPFVETYGDRVFVVWQHKESPSMKEEVYRGWRYLEEPDFEWQNLSATYTTVSAYPVNASGLVTTFIDEEQPPPPDGQYEVYWKRIPDDPLNNISETSRIQSIYPHTSLKYNQIADNELFVVWQEGNTAPYQIKCEKVYVPDTAPAFFSSLNGNLEPSAYVTTRDTFNSTWQIPADIGNSELQYQFSLEPGYMYKVKAIAYQEFGGQCKARLKVDNNLEYVVQYNSGTPKVIETIVPPQLYADSVIEVNLQKISGAGVALGPVYVYRYEDAMLGGGSPGGPMAYSEHGLNEKSVVVAPTVFAHVLTIRTDCSASMGVRIYDVTGRLVRNLGTWQTEGADAITWAGEDEAGRTTAPGIYFVQVRDRHTGEQRCYKVLKMK